MFRVSKFCIFYKVVEYNSLKCLQVHAVTKAKFVIRPVWPICIEYDKRTE